MLILSRKVGESIIINNDIKITVLHDRFGRVRLGIEAPEEIEVWREEIFNRIKAQET